MQNFPTAPARIVVLFRRIRCDFPDKRERGLVSGFAWSNSGEERSAGRMTRPITSGDHSTDPVDGQHGEGVEK
jgi:hypothetical protein